jgi:GNAT superfamily N-acetyltransferase
VDPRLKKLDIEDYERLTDLWETCGLPYRPKGRDSLIELERQLTLSQVAVWGLFDGEKLMASVFATHDGRKGWINRLAVQADYRRRGFAERLIRVAEDWLSSQGIGRPATTCPRPYSSRPTISCSKGRLTLPNEFTPMCRKAARPCLFASCAWMTRLIESVVLYRGVAQPG